MGSWRGEPAMGLAEGAVTFGPGGTRPRVALVAVIVRTPGIRTARVRDQRR